MNSFTWRYLKGDLKSHKGVAIALTVLLTLCCALMAVGAGTFERLSSSVDTLGENTKPPHFLQMHYGDYDAQALEDFASSRPEVTDWLIEDMVGFDSALIAYPGGDLSKSVIDNLFVSQNTEFDFLIDPTTEQPAQPGPGEVYVPLLYQDQYPIKVGDTLTVAGLPLTVKGFLRDGQMVSTMAGSTRFLVHESELDRLAAAGGQPEIIVEYRVNDPDKDVAALQQAYEATEALPRNGQAITHKLLKLISMLSSGTVALAFMFASLVLMAIALLAVRFVIGGTLEHQIHQVGVLKAIGLSHRHIAQLFLLRYQALVAIGCVLGAVFAASTLGPLTSRFSTMFGAAPVTVWTFLVPLLAILAVAGFVIVLCRIMLGRLRKVHVVTALVHGQATPSKLKKAMPLRNVRGGALNWRLAAIDVVKERAQWILLPVAFLLATVLIVLPANLQSTFGNPKVSGYLGVEQADLWLISPNTADADTAKGAYEGILRDLSTDPRVEKLSPIARALYTTPGEKGVDTLQVDVGNHSDTTIAFTDGVAPRDGELALSLLNAEKYGKKVGDVLPLTSSDGTVHEFPVVGIYQDITGGGFTARLGGAVPEDAHRWSIFVDLRSAEDASAIASQMESAYPDINAVRYEDFADQTLTFATAAFGWATLISWLTALATIALITVLFLGVRIARERRRMGLLNVLGFSVGELTGQVFIKAMGLALLGVALGLLLMGLGGSALVSGVLGATGVGMREIVLFPNVWLNYLAIPLSLLGVGALAVLLATTPIRRLAPSLWLRA
ncbi:FtsX-like permease family protein [Corynebacterium kalinowskii]|uniref:FtsX-like permease family protein n=1 Tax=Corynebacterium kalinowskii TaxID=2675216 RepID=A0A6B8VQD9_9CORY|nr:FtsX-like permease family protein [Corynebacterium kalinowskii]QGU00986.1 FtsX-like permease family protein [Corynebacterium kalinowskii]